MVKTSVLLVSVGLGLDIIGAAIIALPDIPKVRLVLGSAVLRKALHKMESNGIQKGELGYDYLKEYLEGRYGVEFPESVWAMRVGQSVSSRYGFEAVFLFTDPNDEREQMALGEDLGFDVDYRVAKKQLRENIDRFEAFVRGTGFLLLSTGFLLQLLAQFVR